MNFYTLKHNGPEIDAAIDKVTSLNGSIIAGTDEDSIKQSISAISGGKGFYYKAVDIENKKIALTTIQQLPVITSASSYFTPDTDQIFDDIGYVSGQKICIVNQNNYNYGNRAFNCSAVIKSVDRNIITYEGEIGFTAINTQEAAKWGIDSYTFLTVEGADIGIPVREGAVAFGLNAKAIGSFSNAEGKDTVALGKYSHAEGQGSYANHAGHAEGQNTKAYGDASHAEGSKTEAHGGSSHTEGSGTKAYGKASHTEGNNTQVLITSDKGSLGAHAEGDSTKASERAAHSEGYGTTASAEAAHAEGKDTNATNEDAHSEGYKTTASGKHSHAENRETIAEGENSHAQGYKTKAAGLASTAMGSGSIAEGESSIAAGSNSIAQGLASTALGQGTTAKKAGSFTQGMGTVAEGDRQSVFGQYNDIDASMVQIVGWGYGPQKNEDGSPKLDENGEQIVDRRNIYTLDKAGNAHFQGSIYSGQVNGSDADKKVVVNKDLTPIKQDIGNLANSVADLNSYKTDVDNLKKVKFEAGSGTNSIQQIGTTAEGAQAISLGNNTIAKNQATIAAGLGTIAARDRQVVIGQYNEEDTSNAFVMGWGWTPDAPKNVMTVSTEGAGWFRGGLFVAGSNKETAQKVATEAKATEIAKNEVTKLVNGAPETLDTLNELAAALKDNKDIVDVLEDAIDSKLDQVIDSINYFDTKQKWSGNPDFEAPFYYISINSTDIDVYSAEGDPINTLIKLGDCLPETLIGKRCTLTYRGAPSLMYDENSDEYIELGDYSVMYIGDTPFESGASFVLVKDKYDSYIQFSAINDCGHMHGGAYGITITADINLETELPKVIDKSKWIKEQDFHHLTGNDFDESKLPETIYCEPINEAWFNTVEGVADPIYDFENVKFTTNATRKDENGKTKNNIQFTKLYSYTDEWGNVRYTFNENYHPYADDGVEGEPVEVTNTSPGSILYSIKLEAAFEANTTDVFYLGLDEYGLLAGKNVVADGAGSTVSGQQNIALGKNTNVLGENNVVRSKSASAFGFGNIVTGIYGAALNEGNKVMGYSGFATGDHNITAGSYDAVHGWQNKSQGYANMTQGARNILSGKYLTCFGLDNKINGGSSLIAGLNNELTGECNVSYGNGNIVSGIYNLATGYQNKVTGDNNTVTGITNTITSSYNQVFGSTNTIAKDNSKFNTVIGQENKIAEVNSIFNLIHGKRNKILSDNCAGNLIVGSDNTINYSNGKTNYGHNLIIGDRNTSNTYYSMALGNDLKVDGGYGTQMVIGQYNDPDRWAHFIIGHGSSTSDRKNIFTIKNDGRAVLGADPIESMDAVTKQYVDCIENPNLFHTSQFIVYDDEDSSYWEVLGRGNSNGELCCDHDDYFYLYYNKYVTSWRSHRTIKELCPQAKVGEYYVFTWANPVINDSDLNQTDFIKGKIIIEGITPGIPFEMNQQILNSYPYVIPPHYITSPDRYDFQYRVFLSATFTNIGLYRVGEVPGRYIKYGAALSKEEVMELTAERNMIQSSNLIRNSSDVIDLDFTVKIKDVNTRRTYPLNFFTGDKLILDQRYTLEFDSNTHETAASISYFDLDDASIGYRSITFTATSDTINNGYITFKASEYSNAIVGQSDAYYKNFKLYKADLDGRNVPVKPKLTLQETLELFHPEMKNWY